ncbi:hypothetical protein JYB87_03750 [Shewanella avicenniae]|uniref:Peptidase M48 domain-containing protein n=1 Tax=Shewanella avicenniae TaxID=2814294 RepID=A0ABX7QTX0_9GAMM|nr:hypothetical protein [Shewanella avicenniae]QSX34376.1 hypothetical protein JYB87_03750 [Shewanella avicenniae]
MIAAAVLASGLFTLPVGERQALVCPPQQYYQCLAEVPVALRPQFPQSSERIQQMLGHRAAMAMPLDDPQFAGIILWAPQRLPNSISALWNDSVYQLSLAEQQQQLTLWHELGHLEIKRLQSAAVLPQQLTTLEHEWLADGYMIWRSARETQSLALAEQQLDRRNMAVFADIKNFSHWTPLYLQHTLVQLKVSELQQQSFDLWIAQLFHATPRYGDDELQEFSGLLQRLFGMGRSQSLPDYMLWRRPTLGAVVAPTLRRVMGSALAQQWMAEQNLLPKQSAARQ